MKVVSVVRYQLQQKCQEGDEQEEGARHDDMKEVALEQLQNTINGPDATEHANDNQTQHHANT